MEHAAAGADPPVLVRVPDVTGLDVAEAQARLQALGFRVSVTARADTYRTPRDYGDCSAAARRRVVGQPSGRQPFASRMLIEIRGGRCT